jgi:hypothetical protein
MSFHIIEKRCPYHIKLYRLFYSLFMKYIYIYIYIYIYEVQEKGKLREITKNRKRKKNYI